MARRKQATKAETGGADPRWVCSTKDVADFFGVSTAAVRLWSKNGCPKIASGRWDLSHVFHWWWENIGQELAGSDDATIQDVKRRYWQAKAEHEELKVAAIKGAMVPRSEVVDAWVARVVEVRGALRLCSKRLGPLLEGKSRREIVEIINAEFDDLLKRYSRGGKHTESEPETVDA